MDDTKEEVIGYLLSSSTATDNEYLDAEIKAAVESKARELNSLRTQLLAADRWTHVREETVKSLSRWLMRARRAPWSPSRRSGPQPRLRPRLAPSDRVARRAGGSPATRRQREVAPPEAVPRAASACLLCWAEA